MQGLPSSGREAIRFGSQAKNVLTFLVITNIITSPLTATLNMLVIIAVKTKSRLRAKKSNILLACLAVTDLAVGVIVQPMLIVVSVIDLIREIMRGLCFLQICTQFMTSVLCNSSLTHLIRDECCVAPFHNTAYSSF